MSASQSDINGLYQQTYEEENKMLHIVWAAGWLVGGWLGGGSSHNSNKEKKSLKSAGLEGTCRLLPSFTWQLGCENVWGV